MLCNPHEALTGIARSRDLPRQSSSVYIRFHPNLAAAKKMQFRAIIEENMNKQAESGPKVGKIVNQELGVSHGGPEAACPECGTLLVPASACVLCPACGWGRCG
jgi:rubrerythrin